MRAPAAHLTDCPSPLSLRQLAVCRSFLHIQTYTRTHTRARARARACTRTRTASLVAR